METVELFDLGYFDPPPDEPPVCGHEHVGEGATGPVDRAGRCRVLAVCEDCGEILGQTGWDPVL